MLGATMAGTAAGAAKATAARLAKRRAMQQPEPQSTTVNDDQMQDVAPPLGLVAFDQPALMPAATAALFDQAVGAIVPEAVDVAGKIIRGKIKASAAVRGNLALRVLELAAKPATRQPGALPAGMAETLQLLAKALGARPPRTIDVDGAELVTPETS